MKTLVLAILCANLVLDLLIETLNYRHFPASTEFERRKKYSFENLRVGFLDQAVQLAFWMVAFSSPLFENLDQTIAALIPSPTWQGAFWLMAVAVLKSILSLPFALYSTFSIEARYGFNTTTWKIFIADRIKGAVLSIALGAPVLALVLYLFQAMGENAWWMTWLTITALSLILGYLAPAVFLPLFNKFEPLPEGELRGAIESYAGREQFSMGGTFIMDGSKRSTKRNAFFTGFGKLRKLVLFDTLVSKHTVDEVVAIVAHEMGHFKLGHIPKMIGMSVVTQGMLFWTLGLFLGDARAPFWVQDTLGLSHPSLAGAFLLISLLYTPVSRVLSVGMLWLSRKHEYEADAYSSKTYGKPQALVDALQKMEVDHLSHPNPHPLKVLLEYSHPPVKARAAALLQQG